MSIHLLQVQACELEMSKVWKATTATKYIKHTQRKVSLLKSMCLQSQIKALANKNAILLFAFQTHQHFTSLG